jgi:hypothetical protein
MGSYADLEIYGHSVFPMKSYVNPELISFFEECDRRVFKRKWSDEDGYTETADENEDEESGYEYRISAAKLRDRLEIQGFSLNAAKRAFEVWVSESLRSLAENEFVAGFYWLENDEVEKFLRSYTFDFWVAQVREHLASGGKRFYDREELDTLSTAKRVIVDNDFEEFLWGFPLCDPRLIIRSLIEVFPDSVDVVLDYSELVSAGYYNGNEELAAQAKSGVSKEFVVNSKIVILTEGSSDAAFLRESLKILHPHLYPLFSFLDFHEPRLAGGASNLVHVLKGLVGAQIANRVIAIFDNDTAAEDALRPLDLVSLPHRFKVLRYPDIPLGEAYPTIGPQGESEMNINGLAGSIELYFGEDILRNNDGALERVQWKGYNQGLRKYQGELIDKNRLQERFMQKIADASGSHNLASQDWSGMSAIWNSIISACTAEQAKTQQ